MSGARTAEAIAAHGALENPAATLAAAGKHFCLECRTALGAEPRCDGGSTHRVVDLGTLQGRGALLDEVWGPASLRRRAREMAKAGAGGAALDSCANGLSGCDACSGVGDLGELGAIILGLIVAAFAAVIIWWIATKIYEAVQRYRAKLNPRGALVGAPKPKGAARLGTVRATSAMDGVAARSFELEQSRWGASAVMLRHASCANMQLAMDDGTIVDVPAGRVRLDGTRSILELSYVGPELVETLVGEPIADADGFELVPFNAVQAIELRVGDRVAVYGPVEFAMDQSPSGPAFRGASRVLVPVGTPSLAKVER